MELRFIPTSFKKKRCPNYAVRFEQYIILLSRAGNFLYWISPFKQRYGIYTDRS